MLGNDTKADSKTITAVNLVQAAHGTVSLNANGGFTYTPTSGYIGTDNFTYQPRMGR